MTPLDLIRPTGQFTLFRVDDIDGDSEARQRWWKYLITMRVVIGLAMCVALGMSEAFGPARVPIALGAALGTLVFNAGYLVIATSSNRLIRWIPIGDFIGVGLLGILAPTVFPAGMVIMMASIGVWTIAFGPRFGLGLLAGAATGYGLITLVQQPEGGAVTWLIFTLGGLLSAVVNGVVSIQVNSVKERYTELVDTISAIVWERDSADTPMTFVNEVVVAVLGVSVQEWLNDDQRLERIHPADRHRMTSPSGHTTGPREFRFIRPDGSVAWLLETVIPAPNDAHPERQRGIIVDITAAKQHQQTVRHLSKVMHEAPIPLWVVEIDDVDDPQVATLVASNRAAVSDPLWGEVQIGDELASWARSPEAREPELAILRSAITEVAGGSEPLLIELNGWDDVKADGRSIRLRVFDVGARQLGIAAEDISVEIESAAALRHEATHDALTGLGNRALLQERLADALAGEDTEPTATLLVMDLNQFKEVNDALGHHHGDRLLTELSHRLADLVDPDMTVARLGGDEFAVLIPDNGTTRSGMVMAQRIIDAFNEPVMIDDISLKTTVSVGMASAPRDGDVPEALLQHADIAMYQAKVQGTGFSVFSPDDSTSRMRRLKLTGDLPLAVERNEFVVHYQPKFDLVTGDPTECEALVRWQHPEFGLLGPVEFIELAEVSGHIQPLAALVIRAAIAEMASLADEFGDIGVAVNLSVRNLYDPGLLEAIEEACESYDFDPHRLTVEITESELVDDPGLALQVLLRLRDMGLGVSIDDFGTGYSSLAYLRTLPATELKVDRSFVNVMTPEDDIVVRAIIELGHNLGMKVVAEGVETTEQRDLLAGLGCDRAQGFLFCHPLGIEDFRRHLRLRAEPADETADQMVLEGASLGRPHLPFGNIAG